MEYSFQSTRDGLTISFVRKEASHVVHSEPCNWLKFGMQGSCVGRQDSYTFAVPNPGNAEDDGSGLFHVRQFTEDDDADADAEEDADEVSGL